MPDTTYTPADIRKMRGQLLDRSNALDLEISDLFSRDPNGSDLTIAIREKSETRKALALIDAM